jgi:hypothetical protein
LRQEQLSASLYCIRESFDVFRTESRLGDSEIYQRIVFLNSDGTTIVDSRPEGEPTPDQGEQARWAPLLAEGLPSLQALGNELVLVAPHQFKSRLTGHLLAWLSVKKIYQHFVGPDDPANRTTALAIASRLLFIPKESMNLVNQEAFPAIESLSMEAPLGFTVPAAKGRLRELLAFRTPVSGTPLALVTIIPDAIRDRIFDPFFTTKEAGSGTGQVAIAHSVVVDKHGGTLTFDSTVGKGTVFTIRLPIDRRPNAAIEGA